MFIGLPSANPMRSTYGASVSATSSLVDRTGEMLTPSALSGIVSGLRGKLKILREHECKLEQHQKEYFETLLPSLYPSSQHGSQDVSAEELHAALRQRQCLMEKIVVLRAALLDQGQQLKFERQQIRDVHAQVYKAVMLNVSRVKDETRRYQREVAKLEQQTLRLQQRCERVQHGAFEGGHQLSKVPEIAHAARCVDLLCPKERTESATLAQNPTDSPLLKMVFGLSKNWVRAPNPVPPEILERLLNPAEQLLEGLAQKVSLSPWTIRFVMQLAGLNALMQANKDGNDLAAQVQSAIRAVLGRAIVSLFVVNRSLLKEGVSISRPERSSSGFDKKYSEWFFPLLNQKKMKFIDSGLSASDPKAYFRGLLSGFSRYMIQACKQSSPLQAVLIQFRTALSSTLDQAGADGVFELIQHCASLSFSDIKGMNNSLQSEPLSDGLDALKQSELGKAMAVHLGVQHEPIGAGSSMKENGESLRRFYLDYNPTPEMIYANAETQAMFTDKLGLLKPYIVPVKQLIDAKALPVGGLSVALAAHTLGAIEHQGTCIEWAQNCFRISAQHQEDALVLSGLEQALVDVELTIQSCLALQEHSQQKKKENKIKERQAFSVLKKAQQEVRDAQHRLLVELSDVENSPLLPLFVHRAAFVSFFAKHVNISTEQLKHRALESGHTASRYNKAGGVLQAIVDVYGLANLPQYGGPAQQGVIDDEFSHAKPIGLSMLIRDGKCVQAKADTSVFSLVRESVNQPWRIQHLYPK